MTNERKECADADLIRDLRAALAPFVSDFQLCRAAYIRRYPRNPGAAARNFDAMPDNWPMETTTFPMGVYRRAVEAYYRAIRIEEPSTGEMK